MARLVRRRGRRPGQEPGPVPDHEAAGTGPRAAGRLPGHGVDALRQHHPARPGALVPRRRIHRAAHPGLHPLERGRHGHPGQHQERGHRRPLGDLRQLGQPLRGRLQPLLRRQGRRPAGRPGLLPGPCFARHLRPRLFGRPAHRGPARPLPHGAGRQRPVLLPASQADAGLLGVPHRLHGPRPVERHLPGPVQPLPPPPPHRRHQPGQGVGVPGRRRVRRAGDAGRAEPAGPRATRQPHLRRQLQPPAAGRAGAGQRQDHPGARSGFPGRRLERHQGHLGLEVGRAAAPGQGRRAAQQDEHHRRRRVPEVRHRVGRLHP